MSSFVELEVVTNDTQPLSKSRHRTYHDFISNNIIQQRKCTCSRCICHFWTLSFWAMVLLGILGGNASIAAMISGFSTAGGLLLIKLIYFYMCYCCRDEWWDTRFIDRFVRQKIPKDKYESYMQELKTCNPNLMYRVSDYAIGGQNNKKNNLLWKKNEDDEYDYDHCQDASQPRQSILGNGEKFRLINLDVEVVGNKQVYNDYKESAKIFFQENSHDIKPPPKVTVCCLCCKSTPNEAGKFNKEQILLKSDNNINQDMIYPQMLVYDENKCNGCDLCCCSYNCYVCCKIVGLHPFYHVGLFWHQKTNEFFKTYTFKKIITNDPDEQDDDEQNGTTQDTNQETNQGNNEEMKRINDLYPYEEYNCIRNVQPDVDEVRLYARNSLPAHKYDITV